MSEVQSVSRALAILAAVGAEPGGLVELSQRVGLPTSTTSRLLATLEHHLAVCRDNRGIYRIGPSVVAMAGPGSGASVRGVARPHMIELARELREAVALSVPSGRVTTTVEQIDAPKPVMAEDWTGCEAPIHAGCAGLVTMAFWPDEQIDEYIADGLERCSEHTVTDPDVLWARIRLLRNGKTFWTHGEFVGGLSSVSAPILNELGQPVASLYTYGPTYRYPAKVKSGPGSPTWVALKVIDVAAQISADLGYRDAPEMELAPSSAKGVASLEEAAVS